MAVIDKERIAQLESEIKQLRKLGRTKREPVLGIGGTIQRLRESKGIGLAELGDLSGISKGLLSRLERTDFASPELKTIIKIANALHLKLSVFFSEHEKDLIVSTLRSASKMPKRKSNLKT
jgi:transcriptional regulator with XRE-family HTH domain